MRISTQIGCWLGKLEMLLNSNMKLCLLLLSLFAGFVARAFSAELVFASKPSCVLKDWGVTLTPLDWDGRLMCRDEEVFKQVCGELGVTMIRIQLSGGNALRPNQAERLITTQVDQFRKYNIKRYMVSIISPPIQFKKYYSAGAFVDGDLNPLREECEGLFVKYIVDVLKLLKLKNTLLPVAISVQSQPDNPTADFGIPPSIAHATPYSIDQWIRVNLMTRHELDENGFASVDLIGPESVSVSWAVNALNQPISGPTGAVSVRSCLAGLALKSSGQILHGDSCKGDFQDAKGGDGRALKGVWLLASHPGNAKNDIDVLLATFLELRHDFVDLSVSHWFYRYGFTWAHGSESLIWGRTRSQTIVYMALRQLWRVAPPDSQVHRISSVALDSEIKARCLGFGLSNESGVTAVLINIGNQAEVAVIKGIGKDCRKMYCFSDCGAVESLGYKNVSAGIEIEVPPRSVSIIVCPRL